MPLLSATWFVAGHALQVLNCNAEAVSHQRHGIALVRVEVWYLHMNWLLTSGPEAKTLGQMASLAGVSECTLSHNLMIDGATGNVRGIRLADTTIPISQ